MIHILLVDNDTEVSEGIKELIESSLPGIYKITCSDFTDFEEKIEDVDIVVSDYKNDEVDNDAGLKVFEKIRDCKFAPIIIYSGYIDSIHDEIKDSQSSFLKVVEKRAGSDADLIAAINEIVESKEFIVKQEVERTLIESINRNFREYFWGIIQENWNDFKDLSSEVLIRTLSRKIIKDLHPILVEEDSIHPIEFYEHPLSNNLELETGSILMNEGSYFVCMTNDCDLEIRNGTCKNTKLNLLEIKAIPADWYGTEAKNKKMLNNNGDQRERMFFLPKTFFFPGGYVEFENLVTKEILVDDGAIKLAGIGELVTKIHPPHIHRLISNFAGYHNRFGTPDIDISSCLPRV